MRSSVVLALSIFACIGASTPSEPTEEVTGITQTDAAAAAAAAADPTAGIEPIEFQLAFKTAARAASGGATLDEAAEVANRVLGGEAVFEPLSAPTGIGEWLCAHSWLAEGEAKLLQHEVIKTEGWPIVGDLDAPRTLRLERPLPPWCQALADRLAPALGNQQPDACDVYACEPGQRTEPLRLDSGGTAAILSLGGSAALLSAKGDDSAHSETYPFPARNTLPLEARSVLLLSAAARQEAASARWGHCVLGGGRHLSLVFRCKSQK